ncbi:hypothetical protein HDV05_005219, partial [Chytridiales sp. JEL 0842]
MKLSAVFSAVVAGLLTSSYQAMAQQQTFTPCGPILPASSVPARYNISTTFYSKYLPGPQGIPIISSSRVADEA